MLNTGVGEEGEVRWITISTDGGRPILVVTAADLEIRARNDRLTHILLLAARSPACVNHNFFSPAAQSSAVRGRNRT